MTHRVQVEVSTRVKGQQTNGVVERFFGTLKYEHLHRGETRLRLPGDGKSTDSGRSITPSDPTSLDDRNRRISQTNNARICR